MDLQPGDTAPDFTLPDAAGENRSLRDYRGQWVLLFFYPRDNTPGCTTEACALRDVYDEIRSHGATVIGISGDSVRSHERFSSRHRLPFTLLSDEENAVTVRYGVYGPKTFMGRTFDGIHRQSVLIDPDGVVAKVYEKVKPAGHAAEVLADLQELSAAPRRS